MITFSDLLAVIGLFVLRLGVPLAVTAGLVYLLKRLDRRWQEEARMQMTAEQRTTAPIEEPARQTVKQTPVAASADRPVRVDVTGRQLPFDPARRQTPGLVARAEGKPCWDAKNCLAGTKQKCAAYSHPDQACWQARLEAEGKIPDACPACEIFQRYPLI